MRQQYGNIQHTAGEVVVISFENQQGIKKMIGAHKFPFVFLLDPTRDVYKLYQMLRPEKGAIINWRTVLTYLRLRLAGYPKYPHGSDVRQMGGDVVIDAQGIIRLIHYSRYPEDRPEVVTMMKILVKTTGKKP